MNPTLRRTLATTAVLAAGATAALTTALAVPGSAESSRHPAGAEVAQLRKDIAKYTDVSVALADGFVPTPVCVELPGVGGMGVHYVNPARLAQPLDARAPQILMYERDGSELRLLGAEFMVPDGDQDLTTDGDRPSLLGQDFDGPMPGHEPGQPAHYDLHVWTHEANPHGVFESWNPRVSC